jgi:hypothetical protein
MQSNFLWLKTNSQPLRLKAPEHQRLASRRTCPEFHPRRGEDRRLAVGNGGDIVRSRCANCMSLVFGGEIGKTDPYTLYAGS